MRTASYCAGSAPCPTREPWSGPSSQILLDIQGSSETKRRKKKRRNRKKKREGKFLKITLNLLF